MQPGSGEEIARTLTERLHTAVVGDVLDALGYTRQFLPFGIRPMLPEWRVAGRAMPVQIANVCGLQEKPFGLLTDALDQLEPGEVYVATGTLQCASWGEILTATAKKRGAVGAVIDGYHRDTNRVLPQNWPVFSRGAYAQDAGVRSRVIGYRCAIEIETIQVKPADWIFGDIEGVVVIPEEVAGEAVERAMEKMNRETAVRREIENGLSSSGAFQKYGVL